MAGINDAVVIGTVLGLIFSAVAYYLYSRLTQCERKVGLMENILLDLKVQTEQSLMATFDAAAVAGAKEFQGGASFAPAGGDSNAEVTNFDALPESQGTAIPEILGSVEQDFPSLSSAAVRTLTIEPPSRGRETPAGSVQVTREPAGTATNTATSSSSPSVKVNQEAHTYKELLGIAKQKNVTGGSHMTKNQLIEALRNKDAGITNTPSASFTPFVAEAGQDQEVGSAHDGTETVQEIDLDATLNL